MSSSGGCACSAGVSVTLQPWAVTRSLFHGRNTSSSVPTWRRTWQKVGREITHAKAWEAIQVCIFFLFIRNILSMSSLCLLSNLCVKHLVLQAGWLAWCTSRAIHACCQTCPRQVPLFAARPLMGQFGHGTSRKSVLLLQQHHPYIVDIHLSGIALWLSWSILPCTL